MENYPVAQSLEESIPFSIEEASCFRFSFPAVIDFVLFQWV